MGNISSYDEMKICYYSLFFGQQIKIDNCPEITDYDIWFAESKRKYGVDHLYLKDDNVLLFVVKQIKGDNYNIIFMLPSIYVTSYGKIIYTTNIDDEMLLGTDYSNTITFEKIQYDNNVNKNNYSYLCQTTEKQFVINLPYDISNVKQEVTPKLAKQFGLQK